MAPKTLPLAALLLGLPLPAAASDVWFSLRPGTLAFHVADVSQEAHLYPRRLDDDGRFVFDPGAAVSLDLPTGIGWIPHLRTTVALYADCAAQPAGYVGVFPMSAALGGENVSFAGGVGLGVAFRRNWKRHVDPNHESDTFADWGAVEGAIGLYGELELRLHPADHEWEVVFNVVPGIPWLILGTVGLRMPLG